MTVEGIINAAARKCAGETGLVLPRWSEPRLIRGVSPVSSPHTMHFWTAPVTVWIRLSGDNLPGLDRASSARWIVEDDLDALIDSMWPDHRRAVDYAVG